MTQQQVSDSYDGVTFPAFTDFSGRQFCNASFKGAVFEGKVAFQKTRFDGTSDFSGAVFKGPSDFSGARFETALFAGASFGEPAKFNNTEFNGTAHFAACRFGHDAHFSHAVFNGPASFAKTEFHAWGLFDSSRFGASTTFDLATFFGSGNFTAAEFAGPVNFGCARFIAFADFQRARFHEANFVNTKLECKTLFRNAQFAGDANFSDCTFTHPTNFSSAVFEAPALFDRVIFLQFVDFSNARFASSFILEPPYGAEGLVPELRFESVTIDHPEKVRFTNISFAKTTLMGTRIRGIKFENPRWPKRGLTKKHAVVYDEIQKDKPDPDKLAQLYKDIRRNLRSAGIRADLGDLFYSEMEVRRKQRRAGNDPVYFLRRYLSPYTLLWLTCGYGRRPFRGLITAGITALIYFS